jgi:uncharacterized protein
VKSHEGVSQIPTKMPFLGSPSLEIDEIDDLLYFTRVNEADDLYQTVIELSQKYNCSERDILVSAVDPNSGNTIIHYCSANGLPDLLKSILAKLGQHPESQSGKEPKHDFVNLTNKEGNTPLHWAAYNGHLEVTKLLIAAGADMWIKNAAGHLAMFEAERAEKSEVVQHLLEAGGDSIDRAATQASTEADIESTENGEGSSTSASHDVAMAEN